MTIADYSLQPQMLIKKAKWQQGVVSESSLNMTKIAMQVLVLQS